MDSVALDVNHDFVFRLFKGDALASGDENAVSCLIVSQDDQVLWKIFANLVLWNPWHIVRDVFGVL
jgi:hypothetical protein